MAGFGLINMNGRLYDPYLQRFLSPDPFIQAPGNAQNFNRYSYCLNNPLMYTDPSGYKLEYDWHLGEYRLDGEWVSHEFATAWMQMNGTTGSSWGGLGEFENSFFGKGGSWSFGITKTNNSWKWTSNADSNRKTGQILITISWSGVPLGTNPLTALMDSWLQGPRSGEPPIASSADRGQGEGSSWFPFGIRNKSSEVIWILENWGDSWQPLKPNDPWFKPFDAVKAHGVIIKVNDVQTYGPFRINIIVVDKVNSMDSGFRYNVLAMSLNQLLNFFYGLFFNKTKETFIPKNTPGWE